MHTSFSEAYDRLNQQQRRAVDTIDGPVLVVAGPGTGKTQLLSLRVATILQRTDTDPGSVLCLTFTNFAATNMRERLGQLVGESANRVVVKTFHGFAAELMNLYPDYFWSGARLQVAPDAAQMGIIQDIISQLPLDNPLAQRFAGNYTALNDIQQAMKLAKEAGLTPDKLTAMLTVNEAYIDMIEPAVNDILSTPLRAAQLDSVAAAIDALPDQAIDATVAPLTSLSTALKESCQTAVMQDAGTGKTTHTGKWKRRWLQTQSGNKGMFDERRRLAWWQALAGVYATYRNQLHSQGYYDYSDMLVEVITQLEQKPELLANVQDRFLYVMIDEFQDSNAAQLRLAHLVASHPSDEGSPNILAVGDDDQSIFAFNGAELNNMLTFRRTYPANQTIILTDNYRSTQAVLDTAQTIIEQAEDRLVLRDPQLSKKLTAQAKVQTGSIGHLQYPTRQAQLTAVAEDIQSRWQENPDQSIAVLARNHASLRDISGLLGRRDVPVRYEQQNNVFNLPLIEQLYTLAEVVTAIGDGDELRVNHYLSRLITHPAWHVPPNTLWELAKFNQNENQWLHSLCTHSTEQLRAIGDWLQWLGQQAQHEPLPVVLEYCLGLRAGEHATSPLRDYFVSQKAQRDADYLAGLSGLHTLRIALHEFTQLKAAEHTRLQDLVDFVRLHKQLDKPLTDTSWFMTGEQAVELLTVHKAKGLEFDTVYVIDAIDGNWQPRRSGRKPPANLPLQPYGEHYDDYVRLLYVAATRARSSLIVSSYRHDEQGKPLLATPLIQALAMLPVEQSDEQATIEALEDTLRWPRVEAQTERAMLQPTLEHYSLSATGLQTFLDVSTGGPAYFIERHLLRLPELTTAHMGFGTAMHRAMQTASQLVNADDFSLSAVLESYEQALALQQLPASEHSRYLPHGTAILKDLFTTKQFKLQKGGQAEIRLTAELASGARLIGALDYCHESDGTLYITDYKTGKPLADFATRDKTKVVKAWRHQTQLLFYALLAKKSGRFTAQKIVTRIVYLEAETKQELIRELTPGNDDLVRIEQLVAAVWSRIMHFDIPDTSEYTADADGIQAFENSLLQK